MEQRKVLGASTASYSLGVSVQAQKLIFISGTVALDGKGQVIGQGSMETQAREIFRRMEMLLREAGASLKDVVKITTFVTDMSQYDQFAMVRKEVFGDGFYPASSTVEVKGLVKEGLLIEVEALATK